MIINASPLIIFCKLNKIRILKKVCGTIEITKAVHQEVVVNGIRIQAPDAFVAREHIDNLDIRIIELTKKCKEIAKKLQTIYSIDIGEAETIALAMQLGRKEAVIDEVSAREAAKAGGIKPIGSLRVLMLALQKGIISKAGAKELIKYMEDSKYRLSPQVLIAFWEMLDKVKKK